MPSVGLLREHFDQHLGLAISLSHIGSGIGQIAGPPLFHYCIDRYGLKGTLLLWAGIQLQLAVCALIQRPTSFYTKWKKRDDKIKYDTKELECNTSDDTLNPIVSSKTNTSFREAFDITKSLFKNRYFILLGIVVFFAFIPFFSITAFLMVAHASDIGMSHADAGLLTVGIGAGIIIGRPIFGWVADRKSVNCVWVLAIVSVVEGILLFIIPHAGSSMAILITLSVLIGMTNSLMATYPLIILRDIVSKEQYTLACGWISIAMGVPTLFASPLFGEKYNRFTIVCRDMHIQYIYHYRMHWSAMYMIWNY